MTATESTTETPLAYTRREAARLLGMSVMSFDRHVQPCIGMVRVGGVRRGIRLVPRAELEKWLAANTETAVGGRPSG